MQCPHCGAVNRAGANHCRVCGGTFPAAQAPSPTHLMGLGPPLSLATAGGPQLLGDDGQLYPLNQSVVELGREPSCQIVLNDHRISRHHAEIRQQTDSYILADLNSSNGTFLNGQRLVNPATLQPGDVISLGGFNLRFQAAQHSLLPAPQPLPPVIPPVVRLASPPVAPPVFKPTSPPHYKKAPQLSGRVAHIDGPVDEEPDPEWAGAILRLMGCLFILPFICWNPMVIIPFFLYGQRSNRMPTRYWRVETGPGEEFVVKGKGDLVTGHINLGDECDFWGRFDGGTLVMQRAYNQRLQTEVVTRSVVNARRNQLILGSIVGLGLLCLVGYAILAATYNLPGY